MLFGPLVLIPFNLQIEWPRISKCHSCHPTIPRNLSITTFPPLPKSK